MAQEKVPKARGRPADLPYQVSVTVARVTTAHSGRMREARERVARARWSLHVALATAAVVLAAVAAVVLELGRPGPGRETAHTRQRAGAAGVAAAFGYPQRCLSIAISAADPDYASAHVDRRGGCGNYRGYINASFHRVDDVWRLILDEGQLFVPNRLLTPATAASTHAGAVPGYPLGCLSVEITLHDARFALAAFDRRLACVRVLSDRARP